jgi:UDP-glucose 4-epimerase
MTVLVTGGAGYVGSHALLELRRQGIPCVVLDNLSRGHRELALDAELVVGDTADAELVGSLIARHRITAVMHFAAFAYVGESVKDPAIYYRNNVASTLSLLNAVVQAGVRQFVFSSTCATYGLPESTPITEEHPQRPVNPYGASKLMVERMLRDYELAYGLRSIAFRYFNAAGADPEGRIGEWHEPETHLIPLVLQTAAGMRDSVEILGTDYPTADGTCIRDYIHVCDLAQAHVLGLKHLEAGNASDVFNLGNGQGFSVREVIDTAERVTGRKVTARNAPRRPGDPHALVGGAAKARRVLGWKPAFAELDTIIDTAWRWHSKHGR